MLGDSLQSGEVIVLTSQRVGYFDKNARPSSYNSELILTNKSLILNIRGIGRAIKGSKVFPLDKIVVNEGKHKVLVRRINSNNYVLEVYLVDGLERFAFANDLEKRVGTLANKWGNAILKQFSSLAGINEDEPEEPATMTDIFRGVGDELSRALGVGSVRKPIQKQRPQPQTQQRSSANNSSEGNSASLDSQLSNLKKLKELCDDGVITQEEFEIKKAQILNLSPTNVNSNPKEEKAKIKEEKAKAKEAKARAKEEEDSKFFQLREGEKIVFNMNGVSHGILHPTHSGKLFLTNQSLIYVVMGSFGKYKGHSRYEMKDIQQAVVSEGESGEKKLEVFHRRGREVFGFVDDEVNRKVRTWAMAINAQKNGRADMYGDDFFQSIVDDKYLAGLVPTDDKSELSSSGGIDTEFLADVAKNVVKSGNFTAKGVAKGIKKASKKSGRRDVHNRWKEEFGIYDAQDELIEAGNEIREFFGLDPKKTNREIKEEELAASYNVYVERAKAAARIRHRAEMEVMDEERDVDSHEEKVSRRRQQPIMFDLKGSTRSNKEDKTYYEDTYDDEDMIDEDFNFSVLDDV